MSFTFRPLTLDDLDAVLDLSSRTPGAPLWTRANYLELFERPCIRIVAETSGMIAGFAIATLAFDIAELETIVVDEGNRRQGIASSLLQSVIAWSRDSRATLLQLEVRVSNHPAIALYESAGFVHDGLRRNYYRSPDEDALLMSFVFDLPSQTVEKNP